MTDIFRKAYSVVGALVMIGYVLQLYFIAAAIFTITQSGDDQQSIYSAFKNADDSFLGIHALSGWIIGILVIVFLALAFGARFPRRTIVMNAVLLVLFIAQVLLAHTGIAALSGLHGINALVLIALTGILTSRNWAFRREASPAA